MPFPLRIPKVQMAALLFLIYLSTLTIYPISFSGPIILTALGLTVFFDLLFTYIRKKILFIPYAAIVTGLIIGLIIDPQSSWYQVAVSAALAMATKNFLRISGKHIFNPAAAGLMIGGIIFSQSVSWWGVSFQNILQFNLQNTILLLILLLPSLISGIRMRRIFNSVTFLISNMILSNLTTTTLLDPTTIFFAIVMLPEPMTTPVKIKNQILFGLSVAVLVQLIPLTGINLPDLFIPALLLGNVIFFKYR